MEHVLEFSNICKAFPGVLALDNVSFSVSGGRVSALMGENGAGKSTLLKILSGDIHPDAGQISINGAAKSFTSPYQSIKSSISVIYQERQLVSAMSVMENVFLDDLHENKLGFVKKGELRRKTQEILDAFGLPIKPTDIVGRLSVAYQQMVEIMKAYRRDSDIIAFDEPTAPLTDKEITTLFGLIRKLKDRGKIILYVSHRMSEIFKISDDIFVLKDGRFVTSLATTETDEKELVKAMVGRDIGDTFANLKRSDKLGDILLEVKNLVTDYVTDVSFELRRGEVLGFAGLIGAGRTEVMRAIFGADPIVSGEIKLEGKTVKFRSPRDAINNGIALCPEDRKEQGLVLCRSIRDNISIPVLSKVANGPFMNVKSEESLACKAVERYSIKTPNTEKITLELSGGNQQKTILGRWTSDMMHTKILILDEPTKGIDVGSKAEIYQMIHDFAAQGIGVIFISSELFEVLNVSDNIVVMRNGRVTGKVARHDATEEHVLELAMKEYGEEASMYIFGIVLVVLGVLAIIPGAFIIVNLSNPDFLFLSDTLGVSFIFFGAIALIAGVLLLISAKNDRARRIIKTLLDAKEFTLIIVIVIVIYLFWAINHNYLSVNGIRGILNSGFIMGVLSVGIGCLLISGKIDLSTGNTGMLAGILIAFLLNAGIPWVPALLIVFVFGAATGLFNAFFVNVMNFAPFISTLALSTIYGGLALIVTNAANIPIGNKSFMLLASTNIAVIFPLPFFIAIILMVAYGIMMASTGFGRRAYMTGGHGNAARLAGINPKKITTILFVNNSIIACLAGALMTSRMNMGSPSSVTGTDLDAITAVVLGGVAFTGGSGNMFGVFLGVVLISCFQTGLLVVGLNSYVQVVAKGLLLVAALVLDYYRKRDKNHI